MRIKRMVLTVSMRISGIVFVAGLVCLISSCMGTEWKQTDRGVIVKVKNPVTDGARRVRVKVLGEKLMHISATPERKFDDVESLAVVPQEESTPFFVSENDTAINVCTSALTASVDKCSGQVKFLDANGILILNEEKRTFTPYEADGMSEYSVFQTWTSVGDDEALYGLGQHQADEFNYKGRNEELFQYNTKVSVPMIVSTKRYGILWDSYSLCRFGNPNDYSQLGEVFRLYDKEGNEGALTGTYREVKKKKQVSKKEKSIEERENGKAGKIDLRTKKEEEVQILVRREPQIYFEHLMREDLNRVVGLPEGFPLNGSVVTYEGDIEARESGLHHFILYYAGYISVYLNDSLVVPERWRTAWNPNSYKFALELTKGERVPLRIEWRPDGAVSYCGLRAYAPEKKEERMKLRLWSQMQRQEEYYFIHGENMDEIISGYRTLTGKAQIMPRWAMGYWQSREKYNTQDEVLSTLKGFRDRKIPIDNIVIDWLHWPQDAWGSHEFDPKRFPDPKAMVDSIHRMNAQVMISVWPKFYTKTEHFKEFDERGWIYQQAIKDSIRDWVGPGYLGSFYDAYDPDARKLFWKQMEEHYLPLGFDAWWMDASEPNIRDCTDIEYRKDLCGPTALGPSDLYFNAYALVNADAIYNGQRKAEPDKRVFLLTRSGFAGLQRYSTATWSGDIATRWEDMKAQISAGLNFASSGIPYWTMDIGGFCVENRYVKAVKELEKRRKEERGKRKYVHEGISVEDARFSMDTDLSEWRELNARWYQFGAFCPIFRSHGQYPYREVWNIAPEGHPCYNSVVYYTRLRYNLMPYIYSLAGLTYLEDYTIMRPLAMDFATDEEVLNIGNQYLFGPALMVAPVCEYGARRRDLYFPEGCGWYDFYSGTYRQGGKHDVVEAPYERIPLYIRSGAILPMGSDMQYHDEKQPLELTLYVYAGADGSFVLYEDENENNGYEKGNYSTIRFMYDDSKGMLHIGSRVGEYPGMQHKRMFRIVYVTKERPLPCDPHTNSGVVVEYDGRQMEVRLN